MEPVVSPWLFYLMGVSHGIQGFCILIGVFAAVGGVAAFAYKAGKDRRGPGAWLGVPLCILALTLWLGAALMPNKQTIIEMAVAQNVTVDRVKLGADVVKKVYDDVLDLARRATAGDVSSPGKDNANVQ